MSSEAQLNSVLERNIGTLRRRQLEDNERRNTSERIADSVSLFAGSMWFVYLHLAIVALWILVNVGAIKAIPRFDETFVILATAASVESIFLSTFILITQNRAARADQRRAELDMHIGLLAEHEVTRLIQIATAIAGHMGIEVPKEVEIEKLNEDVAPASVLDKLEAVETSQGR